MDNLFSISIKTEYGKNGFVADIDRLLNYVEIEYRSQVKNEVKKWAEASKENDEFDICGMHIVNIGSYVPERRNLKWKIGLRLRFVLRLMLGLGI